MRASALVWPLLTLTLATTSPLLGISPSTAQSRFAAEERVSIEVYRKASPAVVTIHTGYGNGSGTIISPEGLVLTGEHVVRGFRTVQVITSTGARYRGWVIATDRQRDLALVRLEGVQGPLPTVPLANADGIQVGQRVFAIGSPFGLSGTLTTGILSRIAPNGDLQTDAAINPGNSGGPLLNSRGNSLASTARFSTQQGSGRTSALGLPRAFSTRGSLSPKTATIPFLRWQRRQCRLPQRKDFG